MNELKKEFPDLSQEDLEEIMQQPHNNKNGYSRTHLNDNNVDTNQIEVLYFNYKTYMNEVYKVKKRLEVEQVK